MWRSSITVKICYTRLQRRVNETSQTEKDHRLDNVFYADLGSS